MNRTRKTWRTEEQNKKWFFNRCMGYTYSVAKSKEARKNVRK